MPFPVIWFDWRKKKKWNSVCKINCRVLIPCDLSTSTVVIIGFLISCFVYRMDCIWEMLSACVWFYLFLWLIKMCRSKSNKNHIFEFGLVLKGNWGLWLSWFRYTKCESERTEGDLSKLCTVYIEFKANIYAVFFLFPFSISNISRQTNNNY